MISLTSQSICVGLETPSELVISRGRIGSLLQSNTVVFETMSYAKAHNKCPDFLMLCPSSSVKGSSSLKQCSTHSWVRVFLTLLYTIFFIPSSQRMMWHGVSDDHTTWVMMHKIAVRDQFVAVVTIVMRGLFGRNEFLRLENFVLEHFHTGIERRRQQCI